MLSCECYVWALAYADDIVLLAPTANAMRHMLKICDIYASSYSIAFNASKSKCIFVQSCRDIASSFGHKSEFFIGGNLIEYVKQWPHLGNIVTDSLEDAAGIASRRNSLCGQMNNLLCYFGKLGHVTKQSLMFSFCTNFYGSELWDLGNPSVQDFCIAWSKGSRQVWGPPYTTHCDLLPVLASTISILDELHRRTANFINNCLSSKCRVVQAIARHGVYFGLMKSLIGRNVFQCCSRYRVRSLAISEVTTFLINKFVHNNINEGLVWKANLILKLIFLKDRSFSLSGSLFNCVDFDCMIEHLCTG